jgi:hypothetical protein
MFLGQGFDFYKV